MKDNETQDTSGVEYSNEYFIKVAPFMLRTFENNNVVIVLSYILSKCSYIEYIGFDKQGWAYVTYGDIYANTRTSRSTAARCVEILVKSGVLEKEVKNTGDASYCYYKPNTQLINKLRDEDIKVWAHLRKNNLKPNKKNYDKFAVLSKEIREKAMKET